MLGNLQEMAPSRADSPVGPRPSPAGTPAARDASHLAPVVCVPPRTVGTRPPAPRCSGWLGNAPSCSGDWNSGRGHPSLPAPPAWGSRGQGQPRPIPGLLTADAQPSLGPAVTPHPKCAPETCRPHVLAWDGSHQSSSWFWSPGQGQWAGKPGGGSQPSPASSGALLLNSEVHVIWGAPASPPGPHSSRSGGGEAGRGCPRPPSPFQLAESTAPVPFNSAKRPGANARAWGGHTPPRATQPWARAPWAALPGGREAGASAVSESLRWLVSSGSSGSPAPGSDAADGGQAGSCGKPGGPASVRERACGV